MASPPKQFLTAHRLATDRLVPERRRNDERLRQFAPSNNANNAIGRRDQDAHRLRLWDAILDRKGCGYAMAPVKIPIPPENLNTSAIPAGTQEELDYSE